VEHEVSVAAHLRSDPPHRRAQCAAVPRKRARSSGSRTGGLRGGPPDPVAVSFTTRADNSPSPQNSPWPSPTSPRIRSPTRTSRNRTLAPSRSRISRTPAASAADSSRSSAASVRMVDPLFPRLSVFSGMRGEVAISGSRHSIPSGRSVHRRPRQSPRSSTRYAQLMWRCSRLGSKRSLRSERGWTRTSSRISWSDTATDATSGCLALR
jgi:hypothetical protein